MGAPEIGRIQCHGGPAMRLGLGVAIALFQRETMAAEHRSPGGKILIPVGADLFDRSQHQRGTAQPEGIEMHQPEGEQIGGVRAQDLLPHGDRLVQPALDPGLQSGQVQGLAFGDARGGQPAGTQSRRSGRHTGLLETQQGQVPLQALAHREQGLLREGFEQRHRGVGPVRQVALHGQIERGASRARGGCHEQAVQVGQHREDSSSVWGAGAERAGAASRVGTARKEGRAGRDGRIEAGHPGRGRTARLRNR
jgi:hypothetical protein